MMSPMALRRTMSRLSNRGAPPESEKESVILTASRLSRPCPRARTNDLGGRVSLGIPHDDHSASAGFALVALGDALHRVIRAFGVKVRTDFANNRAHILFWKNYDGVYIRQRRQNFRALLGRHHCPPLPLHRSHGSI